VIPQLPTITKGFPGIGGKIKLIPVGLVAEEIPLYDPSGKAYASTFV
jgi:hypothetical protein